MSILAGVIGFLGIVPLWQAWKTVRNSSLAHACMWAGLAWAHWVAVFLASEILSSAALQAARYVGLCLTGCAGVAVLGARRPGVGPWNFVVVALLAVNLLPVAEGFVRGQDLSFDWLRASGILAAVLVGCLNYLPTRAAPAALLLLLGASFEMSMLVRARDMAIGGAASERLGWLALAAVPWLALLSLISRGRAESQFDLIWRSFRDRYGLVWSQRVREQFNASARNNHWPVVLRWQGLRLLPGQAAPNQEIQDAMLHTLAQLLRRFLYKECPGG